MSYPYYVILDFEATCDYPQQIKPMEIIEFPSVIVETATNTIISEFQIYVKPVIHPKLTKFCTELTGITQETVDKGVTFEEALKAYNKWLSEYGLYGDNFVIVTCGDWDIKTEFPVQCKRSGVKIPSHFKQWVNIKKEFARFYGIHKPGGLLKMLTHLGYTFKGRHHSGIVDCRNTARIWMKMHEDGYVLNPENIDILSDTSKW